MQTCDTGVSYIATFSFGVMKYEGKSNYGVKKNPIKLIRPDEVNKNVLETLKQVLLLKRCAFKIQKETWRRYSSPEQNV
jgi:hypothetical protein